MIKFVIVFAFFSSSLLFSDDLQISEDFKEGDVVSAETFNQIFDVIEKVNRTITDEDLLGTWTCSAVVASDSSRSSSGWADKGFAYILNDSQLNFTSSFALSGTTAAGIKSVDFLILCCAVASKAWHTMWRKGSEYFARRCSQAGAARRRRQTIQAQPSVIS